ncbi:MAG: hypothetical protein AUK37_02910 [Rhodobacterales bacterium CG2_30_65_12]|nr:MAG: hypothetical protein AUK37_02910 [Rhodobacterales bacterium CG2_30_65_12]
MRETGTLTVKTLLGAFAQAFALFAMLVQFALYADHIGAAAVAGIGAAGPGERLGFLEICTGSGVQRVSADGTPAVDGHNDCPICTNASILAFGEPAALATPVFDFVPVAEIRMVVVATSPAEARFPGAKPIRAPPV